MDKSMTDYLDCINRDGKIHVLQAAVSLWMEILK